MRRIVALTAILIVFALAAGGFFLYARAQQVPNERVHMEPAAAPHAIGVAPRAIVIAAGAQFRDIRGIAVDAAGNVFISAEISPAPERCIASSAAANISVAIFSNCASAPAEDPSGIAATRTGAGVFLANRAQNSIRLLDMLTGRVAVEPGANLRVKQRAKTSGLSASQFAMAGPEGLATDSAENLYVADRGNNRVLRLSAAANDFSSVAHVLDAAAVATDASGREIYVASPASNQVFRIDAAAGEISVFAGTGAPPEALAKIAAQFPAPTAAAQAALSAPEGVAVDAGGNVFIADTGANAILRVDAKTNLLSPVALGSELNSPGALAIDRRGNLFVADRGNHRVMEFPGAAQTAPSGTVTLTPASNNFGNQPTGGSTPQQTFVLANGTSSALTLSTNSFTMSGNNPNDFVQTNNCVPQLAAGSSCQVFVSFGPQGTGARAGTLSVTDSDPSSPQTTSLTGTGDTFNLTAANSNATMQTVVPGDSGNYTLSVTPDSVFGGTVTLSCPTQLPDATMTCSINPAQLTITPGQASQFSVTITTQSGKAPAATGFRPRPRGNSPDRTTPLAALLLLVFGLAAVVAGATRRGKQQAAIAIHAPTRRRRAWAISCLAIVCAAGAAGCYNSASHKYIPVTLPGAYLIDIKGTAQNSSRAITLTLNVE